MPQTRQLNRDQKRIQQSAQKSKSNTQTKSIKPDDKASAPLRSLTPAAAISEFVNPHNIFGSLPDKNLKEN